MRVRMVKKQFADGSTCQKCVQAEELLRRRGLWERIDQVVWANEADAASEGMRLAAEHQVELAPFFVVEHAGETQIFTSVLKLIADVLSTPEKAAAAATTSFDAQRHAFKTRARRTPLASGLAATDASALEPQTLSQPLTRARPSSSTSWVATGGIRNMY